MLRLLSTRIPVLGIRASYATSVKDYESLYDVLDTDPSCTKTELRESWLKLSMLYHPDLNKDSEEAKAQFMKIKEAYETLIDDKKRADYNNKIGFVHHDPPPDYHRELTLQGEQDRVAAKLYRSLWNEKRIIELMSSEALREVDWANKSPAERYRILVEEEEKQKELADEMYKVNTPTLKQGSIRYFFILTIGTLLSVIAYRISLIEDQEFVQEHHAKRSQLLSDVELKGGGIVDRTARQSSIYYSYAGSLSSIRQKNREDTAAAEESN